MAEFYQVHVLWRSSPYVYWDSIYNDVIYGQNVYDVFNRVVCPITQTEPYPMQLDDPTIWVGCTSRLHTYLFSRSTKMHYEVSIHPNDWTRIHGYSFGKYTTCKRTSDKTLIPITYP
jgi:hypothetical protein